MKTLTVFLALITSQSFGQISDNDGNDAKLLMENYQNHIDSIRQLTNDVRIYYFSDTLFKGILLTLSNGEKIQLDLRYKDNFRGYTELGADFENFVLVKHRGDGSGNAEELRVINKSTGEDKWLGKYPFYFGNENEICVYEAYKDSSYHIVIHNFSSNKIESYPVPDTKCLCCGCFEIGQFDETSFSLKFVDPGDNPTEVLIKRFN